MKKSFRFIFFINSTVLFLLFVTVISYNNFSYTMANIKAIEARKCVIIDAGHGGVDGGTTSCSGITESVYNLQIALRLQDLMHLLGIKTTMVRTTDTSIHTEGETIASKKISDLKNRVKLVENTQNSILISIHQNYYHDSRYAGAQVFYANKNMSHDFAVRMQNALVSGLRNNNTRKAKKADSIYLLQKITRPGILIECGFLSNPKEESMLRSDDYQKKLCVVIAAATSSYLFAKPVA